jgi:hypothetical protein
MAGYDGQVVINTKLDDKGLKQGITGLQNTSVNALKKVKGVLAAAGIGIGVASAVKGINNLIKSTAEYTDRIDKQSQKIGMSKRGYQEWDFILSDLGANVDGLQLGLKTLSSAMDEANRGNKEYGEMFRRLGVNIVDTNGKLKDQETIFNEVFSALAGMESQTERTAIASRLLGRSATELAPALNAGADEIEFLKNRAYELNTVLDDTTIAIGVNFGDQVDRMKRALQTASARAIAPFMDDLADLATKFSDETIPALEKFMTTAVKVGLSIPPVFAFMKAVVVQVLKEIGEALDGPWEKLKGFVNDLLNMPVVKNTIDLAIDLAGDLWEGLKKGATTGEWGDFWKAAVGAAEFAIGIMATLKLAGMAGAVLWSSIQTALKTAGFSTAGIGTAGLIAMVSVGLAVVEAMQDGDYSVLAANMIAALTAALVVGGLTKSPNAAMLTFTVALNFKVGETIMNGLVPKPYQGDDAGKSQVQDIIRSPEGLLSEWGATSAARKKLVAIWGVETGRQILAGLGIGLADIDKIGEESARVLLSTVQDELGIQSPSKEFKQIGQYVVEGLINGLVEMMPELEDDAQKMVAALEKIWEEGEYKAPAPAATGSAAVPAKSGFGSDVGNIFSDIKAGWKEAKAEMTAEIADWTGWAKGKFLEIGPAFGNAIGAGMRSLGQFLATQKQTIADLGQSIADIQDQLADAQDELTEAQDDYNDAVLSGDKDAIKAADKRLKQQQKLIDGLNKQEKALKDEKKSIEDGSAAWKTFGKVMLQALADVLYGIGAELAARAAIAAVTFNWAGAAVATAGSVAAFAAGIAVDSWAGSYAEGGIIPQVAGLPSTGDRHVANVNPGELILNQAQQSAVAAQLTMFSRLTDLLSSLQFSAGGGIHISMAGATINGLNEDAVGRAIYHNIRSLQAEGVLKSW